MILLLNAKITDVRHTYYRNYIRGGYPTSNRFDVFKYTLASYAVMDELVSKFILYIELAEEFIHRKQELEEFIYEIFPNKEKLIVNWYRINYIKEWREVYNNIAHIDDLIWLACNDDHVFLDSSLDLLAKSLETLKKDPDELACMYYSHWLEGIRMANHFGGQLQDCENFVKCQWGIYDAILLIKRERFRRYWSDYEDDGRLWFKPDAFYDVRPPLTSTFYIPTKEIVRHFDGYSHVGNFANIAPALVIPPGFFEKNIKIKYGYDHRFEDAVNINPKTPYLFSVDPSGTDYKWSLSDIPLFWKNRITEIDINPNINHEELNMHRNHNYVLAANVCQRTYLTNFSTNTPTEWLNKHLLK